MKEKLIPRMKKDSTKAISRIAMMRIIIPQISSRLLNSATILSASIGLVM